jgi:serine/threonine protein kinase
VTRTHAAIGPYRLLHELGSGAMGRVYLAATPGGRDVAVKVVHPELAARPEFRARFAQEVAAARAVSGAYTAPVVDADPQAPLPWLATAYVAGPSLLDAVDRYGPMAEPDLRRLALGLIEAVKAIHAAGVIHRDLKPGNVMLSDDGPRVIDFGISRALEGVPALLHNPVLGTPGYLSPEQARQDTTLGPASDVFSLGAVLCFAATGRGPFDQGAAEGLTYRVIHEQPELSAVPVRLLGLVEACLRKIPSGARSSTICRASSISRSLKRWPLRHWTLRPGRWRPRAPGRSRRPRRSRHRSATPCAAAAGSSRRPAVAAWRSQRWPGWCWPTTPRRHTPDRGGHRKHGLPPWVHSRRCPQAPSPYGR